MNRKTALATLAAFVAAFALALSAVFAGGTSTTKTATAETISNLRYVTLATNTGTTSTLVSGTGVDTQYYGSADCFATYTVGTLGVTFTLQSSLDNSNWASVIEIPRPTVAGTTTLTRTPLYGTYTRVTMGVSTTNAITASVKCKLLQNFQ